jgi:hypothetical protein
MKKLTYDYPLLNKIEPDDITYKDVPYLRTEQYVEIPREGDTLKYLEFPPMLNLRELELNFVQGEIQYRIRMSRRSAALQRIEFEGLGLPLGLADKHPLMIRPSMFLTVIRYGYGHVHDQEYRNLLYRGCRYKTKYTYWTSNKGFVMTTTEAERRVTKIRDIRTPVESPYVYNYLEDEPLRQYIEVFPKWVIVGPPPSTQTGAELKRVVTVPKDKAPRFHKWCEKYKIKIYAEWMPAMYPGVITKSGHDQRDELIELLKKYNIAYTL